MGDSFLYSTFSWLAFMFLKIMFLDFLPSTFTLISSLGSLKCISSNRMSFPSNMWMSLCSDSIVSFRIVNPAASFRAPINFLHLISPFSITTWLKGISGIPLAVKNWSADSTMKSLIRIFFSWVENCRGVKNIETTFERIFCFSVVLVTFLIFFSIFCGFYFLMRLYRK